jgi:hypothetical protein
VKIIMDDKVLCESAEKDEILIKDRLVAVVLLAGGEDVQTLALRAFEACGPSFRANVFDQGLCDPAFVKRPYNMNVCRQEIAPRAPESPSNMQFYPSSVNFHALPSEHHGLPVLWRQ